MTRFTEPICDPTGIPDVALDTTLAPRLDTLEGSSLGLLSNGKPNAGLLLSALGEHLRTAYGVGEVVPYEKDYFGTPVERTQLEEIVQRCSFAVAATGD